MELSFSIQHYAGKVRSCDFYLVQIIVAWSLFAFKPEFLLYGFFPHFNRKNDKVYANIHSAMKFSCVAVHFGAYP